MTEEQDPRVKEEMEGMWMMAKVEGGWLVGNKRRAALSDPGRQKLRSMSEDMLMRELKVEEVMPKGPQPPPQRKERLCHMLTRKCGVYGLNNGLRRDGDFQCERNPKRTREMTEGWYRGPKTEPVSRQ